MPIKLPRFRRKSVGNSLDATYQAAEPESPGAPRGNSQFSFDEIERPAPQNRSHFPQYPQPQYQQGYSTHLKYGDSTGSSSASRSNSNSGGSSGTGYYASDRQSSSSTLPSSADIPRTPPSTEDHYRTGYAVSDSMSLKDPMAYGTAAPVSRGGWQNSKAGPMSKGPSSGPFKLAEPPRLETALDSEPLFGDDMFKFTSDGKRMSAIGLLDAVGPKAATSLFIPSKDAPIDPVPPVPPPKSVNSGTPQGKKFLDSRIHGDDEDIYPSAVNSRYQAQVAPSLPSPKIGDTRLSPGAKKGLYPWESRQDTEEDSLMSGEKSPSPGPPAPPPKQENYQPRHNRTLTPASTLPLKVDSMDSLATPPQTGRAPRNEVKEGVRRAIGMGKRPTTTSSNGSQEETRTSPASTVRRKELPSSRGSDTTTKEEKIDIPPPPPIPTTTVTLSSPPKLPRVKTAPVSLPQDNLFSDSGSQRSTSKSRPQPARAESDDLLTATLMRDAAIASSFEAGESDRLKQPRKVFTKAQFERYKAQQEEERQYQARNGKKDDDDSESDLSEDDDEIERQRTQAKQRAKQDAHLSVYRQQMMKITGSHGTDTTNLQTNSLGMMNKAASNSTPMLSLSAPMPHLSISSPSSAGDKSDGEDEEVPLGILMAHGFPSKTTGRPPTRLSNSNSSPNLRSVSGTTQFNDNSSTTNLPPFARHLPADPYFGAGLVNSANRVSMAPSSLYGGSQRESQFMPPPQQPRPSPPGRYPTGLIGNIVRDEELRAARRGGAQQAPFYNEAMMSSAPISSPQPSPGGDVQLQMASQMTQMMQLQMQWMQMQQQQQQMMMGMPGSMPMMPPASPMGGMGMMGGSGLMPNMMMPGQRAMSMVDTGSLPHFQPGPGLMPQQQPPQTPGSNLSPGYAGSVYGHTRSSTLPTFMQPGYTPSIAPSERSNIGQPSRYRPVTYQTGSGNSSGGGDRTRTLLSAAPPSGLKTALAPKDDSDDEDGWAEMANKKKEKKETWRKKKETGIRSVLKLGSN
ncbi:hypothetical protein TWF106_011123 [Orbilia oligospora]|uniref:Uncharacterized protein n=1 Tax=Orbilia oligospora TaxID=2813651 RepID=A0A6G1M2Q9_ORBOL|nr:hypothetical protein TWF788_007775 [Orbilia oligospora]KAF3196809.1 hypothetical protein TWF191_006383 [Orbilia oligospora]KAF3206797.1 hypothetical protein TWF679_008580 [Orbilia oligospora]KAF3208913.1 hypothetical protein TWF106_011123 [Orbilia oligospora]KAF3242258.1 hypothetical protein TWF192_008743 [Orbilia oligospora]